MTTAPTQAWEAIVIGAGPGGLTAALYLARYRRRVLVLHDGSARALHIPLTHNAPGFDQGISGPDLIERMTRHAREYGAIIEQARVTHVSNEGQFFKLGDELGHVLWSRSLILATGLQHNQIPLDEEVHQAAIDAGVLRYCPICDGFEHIDTHIGVIGCDEQGAAEALFLRRYSADITLIPLAYDELPQGEREQLAKAGIKVIQAAAIGYTLNDHTISVALSDGGRADFDVLYPALGCRPRTELAVMLGIQLDEDGCLPADTPFESMVPGLYSAGDVVEGLDQINVAIAHGAIAATKAHNWLRELDGEALMGRD